MTHVSYSRMTADPVAGGMQKSSAERGDASGEPGEDESRRPRRVR